MDHGGWRALKSTSTFCSLSPTPASARWKQGDDGGDVAWGGVCSFRGIDNSIFLTVMLCLLFYFWLSGRAACTYMETCFPFPAIHWNMEMFALSLLLWYGFAFLSSYILKPPATKGICSKWVSYFYFTSVSLLSVPCIAFLFPPCRRLGTDLRRLKWTFCPLAHFKIEA